MNFYSHTVIHILTYLEIAKLAYPDLPPDCARTELRSIILCFQNALSASAPTCLYVCLNFRSMSYIDQELLHTYVLQAEQSLARVI